MTGEPMNAVEVRLRASPGDHPAHGPRRGLGPGGPDRPQGGRAHHPPHRRRPSGSPSASRWSRSRPASLTLNLERTLEKVVPVRPRLLGRPAPGFEVAEVTASRRRCASPGPKSRVQEVESAFTEPLSVEGARSTVVDQLNIGLDDPVLRIQGSPRVKVTARIQDAEATRAPSRAWPWRYAGGAASVRPARIRVVLTGPPACWAGCSRARYGPTWTSAARAYGSRRWPWSWSRRVPGVTVREVEPDRVIVGVSRPRRSR